MSSQQPFSAPPLVGEVHHIHHLSDHFGRLYISDEYSDVILVVEKNRIPAHKVGSIGNIDFYEKCTMFHNDLLFAGHSCFKIRVLPRSTLWWDA